MTEVCARPLPVTEVDLSDAFQPLALNGMEPEKEDGNVEYKRILTDESDERVQRLASQMRYRCNEGGSECIYRLGVDDDGTLTGLTVDEFAATMRCIERAAKMNSMVVHGVGEVPVGKDRRIHEICIREHNQDSYIDIKVAIAGSVDCGKSTLLSVLCKGQPDNGRGAARLAVFNFAHEVESGRTSSVGHQILGYDAAGNVMNYADKRIYAWPEVVKRSSKIISFYDLAGHEKYLKTTIFGLSCSQPDMSLIMVGGNRGVLRMTLEHVFLCKTLGIPFGIVVTKVDMLKDKQNVLDATLQQIVTLLKRPAMRRHPLKVKTAADIVRCAQTIHSESVVPIFQISNVTMEGIDSLHAFLNLLPKRSVSYETEHVECHLDASWTVPGVGTVVGGHLMSGSVAVGDKLWFGPYQNGYVSVTVRTLHCKRVPVQRVAWQSYVCIAVKGIRKKDVRKGTVLVSSKAQQVLCARITADVQVLKTHSTTIRVGYQPILHSQNSRCSVTIEAIEHKVSARGSAAADPAAKAGAAPREDARPCLQTGDTALVTLRLNYGKRQFIKPGNHVLLCEGRTKVVGVVKAIHED
jgi:GTPase